jgi:hypothetical protein
MVDEVSLDGHDVAVQTVALALWHLVVRAELLWERSTAII